MAYKKPRLGQKVYLRYEDQLFLEKVGFLGKETFVIEDYGYKSNIEYYYYLYNESWFTSIEQFKDYFKNNNDDYKNYKLVKLDDDLWEIKER